MSTATQPIMPKSRTPSGAFESCCPADGASCSLTARLPWFRLALGVFVAAQTMLLGMAVNLTGDMDPGTRLVLDGGMLAATLLVMILLGWPLAAGAVRELMRRRLTMELLFIGGILSAFGLSLQAMLSGRGAVYFEVVSLLLIIYSAGRAIGQLSRQRAAVSVDFLTREIRMARLAGDGQNSSSSSPSSAASDSRVPVEQVSPGDRVLVWPGEIIPVDGWVVEGLSLVRQTAFTGQRGGAMKRMGDEVLAGTACEDGMLVIEATSAGTQRRVDKLAELIDSARRSPTSLQRQADRMVRWFLPLVMGIAILTGWYWWGKSGAEAALYNGLAVLLVACPCAAGLATPLVLWSVLGTLASRGLVLRGGDAIERLAEVDGVIFDKTGTLGDEELILHQIRTDEEPLTRSRTLAIIRAIERCSTHPVATALSQVKDDGTWSVAVQDLRILPGRGVEAIVRVSPEDQSRNPNPETRNPSRIQLVRDGEADGMLAIRMTIDGQWAATAVLVESLRDTAPRAVERINAMGLPVRIMTGDVCVAVAGALGAATVAMTPEQKHAAVVKTRAGPEFRRPLFVGDGVNDVAAMAAAHVSIALAHGAQIATETASATLHGADLNLVPEALEISRRAVAMIRSNLRWALAYNAAGIVAAASGLLHPILAAVLMGMSSAIVSWRSFHVTDQSGTGVSPVKTRTTKAASAPAPRQILWQFPQPSRTVFSVAHILGLLGQGIVLIVIADLKAPAALVVLIAMTAMALLIHTRADRLPAWADMTLAMVSVGGLGMNLGWWIDLNFASAVVNGAAMSCCGLSGQGTMPGHPWMYAGMLALGVPAMYLLRRTPEYFSLRRGCCLGTLLVGVPAMCIGMNLGGVVAGRWRFLNPHAQVLNGYAWMMLGMVVGMLLPHTTGFLIPRGGENEASG